MRHGAKRGERHEPDIEKLQVVQKAIMARTGRYVPFAQHGGTGASYVARGLVGKHNVNTHFLVAGANYLAGYSHANYGAIREGDKKVCGTALFSGMIGCLVQETVEKLKETGSYGIIDMLGVGNGG